MKTARLDLVPLDLVPLDLDRDLGALHAMFSDAEWARGGYMTPTASVDESRERLVQEFGDNGGWTWVLRVRPDEDAAGAVGVFSDQGSSIRGMSWYLRRERWGAGLMSEFDDFARLGFTEWNGQSGLEVRRATGDISPATVTVEVGVLVDPLYDAAHAAGLVSTLPQDTPWYRRTFTLVLPEGHRLTMSGPLSGA